jgi:hypothetical protein
MAATLLDLRASMKHRIQAGLLRRRVQVGLENYTERSPSVEED